LGVGCGSPNKEPAVAKTSSALTTPVDYRSLILSHNPIGYWRLGDSQANGDETAKDETGRNNGTYTGRYTDASPTAPPTPNQPGATLGDSDSSAFFYISNNPAHSPVTQWNWVYIPNKPNQAPTRPELTLEAWFTIIPGSTPQTYAAIISKTTANLQDGYGFFSYSGSLYFYINNLNIRVGVPYTTIGDTSQFHHVVGVYGDSGTTIKIYIDGVLIATRGIAVSEGRGKPVNAGAGPLQIGSGYGLGWGGRLDEVAVYDHELPADQIHDHFQAARPPGPLSREFVAYAQQRITLGTGNHVVGGDLGIASIAPAGMGPQLTVGASDIVDPQRTLFAPSISLGAQAQVGNVDTNALTNAGATLGSQQPYPASSMPVLPLSAAATAGTTNVNIKAGSIQSLSPGNYGTLTIYGTLRLKPGNYSFSSITLADGAILQALPYGNTQVQVATSFTSGASVYVGQAVGIAGAFTITVAGTDPSSSTPALAIGTSNGVVALLNAPRGTISIGDNSGVNGALSAFDISIGSNVTLNYRDGIMPDPPPSPGSQIITSYTMPPASPIIGPVPASQTVSVALGLPLTDLLGLQAIANASAEPSSPTFRQHLTPADLAKYLPSDSDYGQLIAWAQAKGFSPVKYPHKIVLDVTGPAAQVEQALSINLNLAMRADGTVFFGPDRMPRIGVGFPVLGVSGIDDYVPLRHGAGLGGTAPPGDGSFQGSDVRSVYLGGGGSSCAGLFGDGQSIGIAQFDGFDPADIGAFEMRVGLLGTTPPLEIQVSGDPMGRSAGCPTCPAGPLAPPLTPTAESGTVEASADIEAAISMAPRAQIIVFQGANQDSVLADMAANPQVGSLSSSWSLGPSALTPTLMAMLAAQGQSIGVYSGDNGAFEPPTLLPGCPQNPNAFVPYDPGFLTFVGGTVLNLNPGAPLESTWTGSGGGVLTGVTMPLYQAFANPGNPNVSTVNRTIPDISMDAVNFYSLATTCGGGALGNVFPVGLCTPPHSCTPLPCTPTPMNPTCYATVNPCPGGATGGNEQKQTYVNFGGTSLSTPLFAGFLALANELRSGAGLGTVGFVNPALYQIGRSSSGALAFQDIQDGIANQNWCGTQYQSVAGYDPATGWGAPRCGLILALATEPRIQVGVADSAGGPYVCVWGSGFTPNGTATIQYAGVPEMPTVPGSNPPVPSVETVFGSPVATASGVLLTGGGRFDTLNMAAQIAAGVPACTPSEVANGMVSISVTDDATGISSTAQVPAKYWCQTGLPTFGTGCAQGTSQLSAGPGDVCAVVAGSLQCWGNNAVGQIGNGNSDPRDPVQPTLLPLATVAGVASGAANTCAVFASRTVACWGSNSSGQLGEGNSDTNFIATRPVAVSNLNDATSVAVGGEFACALRTGGFIDCWGSNSGNELGVGNNPGLTRLPNGEQVALTPLPVVGINNAIAISAGDTTMCALLGDGTVRCWGGILSTDPSFVNGVSGAKALAHRCAILGDGGVACWNFDRTLNATRVTDLPGPALAIADSNDGTGSPYNVCVVLADGSVECKGDNDRGQLGNGTTNGSTDHFVAVQGLPTRAVSVALGFKFACASLENTDVWCWGDLAFGTSPQDLHAVPIKYGLAPL
jgi:hypothetical protein